MQTATVRQSHLKLLPDPTHKIFRSASTISSTISTDEPLVQYAIDRISCPARREAEVHAYHIRGEGAITRSVLLGTVPGIDPDRMPHYKDVIDRVTGEPGSWPLANSAYIVFHTGTDPLSSMDEGKQLIPLMSLVKDFYSKNDSLMIMSVVLRDIGKVDVYTT